MKLQMLCIDCHTQNKKYKEEMYMKYRLLVKVGKSWKHGRVVYDSYLEAQIRQEELRLAGIKSRITDELGCEL